MLTGYVTPDNEAVLPIEVLGADGRILQIEAGIDTGYNGFLTLPKRVIEALDLTFVGPGVRRLSGEDPSHELTSGTLRERE